MFSDKYLHSVSLQKIYMVLNAFIQLLLRQKRLCVYVHLLLFTCVYDEIHYSSSIVSASHNHRCHTYIHW